MRRALLLSSLVALVPLRAGAFEAATTHAGLTEQAALASRLGRILAEVYARPLGLYEPLKLDLPSGRGERLAVMLGRLDAAGGYAPVDGKLPAIEWLVAGSVVEETEERGRHHFYDPATAKGLDQGGFIDGFRLRVAGVSHGSSTLRGLFTGAGFDGTGRPSVEWMVAPDNDLSLQRHLDARERSVTGRSNGEREAALADALLTAGALLHIVEDAGEPALAHADFRAEFQGGQPLRRWIGLSLGRLGVPPPSGPATPVAHLTELITNRDNTGLADRTARRFHSRGSLTASKTLAPPLVAGPARGGYASAEGVPHLARWDRGQGDTVHWSLDSRCHADYARRLLPEAGQAALSALEHLFRGNLVVEDGAVKVGLVDLGTGQLTIVTEDQSGVRQVLASRAVIGGRSGDSLGELPAAPSARRVAIVFRGVDGNGEPIVVSLEQAAAQ